MKCIQTFWISIQCSWFRRIRDSSAFWIKTLQDDLTKIGENLEQMTFWGETKFLEVSNKIQNPFWCEVLSAATKLMRGNNYTNPQYFQLNSLANNPLIKIGNKVIKKNKLSRLQVADFFQQNSTEFLDVACFNSKNNQNMSSFEYTQYISSIKSGCKKLGINIKSTIGQFCPKQPHIESIISSQTKGCQKYYKILMKQTYQQFNTSNMSNKWYKELGVRFSLEAWEKYYKLVANFNAFKLLSYLLKDIWPQLG